MVPTPYQNLSRRWRGPSLSYEEKTGRSWFVAGWSWFVAGRSWFVAGRSRFAAGRKIFTGVWLPYQRKYMVTVQKLVLHLVLTGVWLPYQSKYMVTVKKLVLHFFSSSKHRISICGWPVSISDRLDLICGRAGRNKSGAKSASKADSHLGPPNMVIGRTFPKTKFYFIDKVSFKSSSMLLFTSHFFEIWILKKVWKFWKSVLLLKEIFFFNLMCSSLGLSQNLRFEHWTQLYP